MSRLIYNAIRTPDGTVLVSRHRHDYNEYTDKNGLEYAVDGGLDYAKRIVQEDDPYEELSVFLEDDHEVVREAAEWGTYGIDGKADLMYVKLANMSYEHILACLANVPRMHAHMREVFLNEIHYRDKNGLASLHSIFS